MSLNEIYKAAGLTTAEIKEIPLFINGETKDPFYEHTSHDKLYEYFAFEVCEMPYGVAKARTGTPDEWIMEKLESLGAGGSQ